jgi:NADH:ubiquinone oxidoreductase subunit 6 (subunit J)
MVVLSTCGLFLLQAAPFLMAATIIIYAGAIVVTFLFVLMLAQQDGQSNADHRSREPLLASAAGFILLGCLLAVLHSTYGGLDEFVDRAKQAAEASTVKEWEPIVGKDDDFFKSFRKVVLRTREGRPPDLSDPVSIARANLADTLEEARRNWNAIKTADQPNERFPLVATEFKKQMAEIVELAHIVRVNQGTLLPSSQLPLSRFAGSPASEPARTDNSGRPLERLPAANVAGLGKTLFTDYLLAVELGGTLLFVAVIGTIAIAGRRPEGLR